MASLNCWEIPSTANYAESCLQRNSSSVSQSDNVQLDRVKLLIKLFPFLFVFLAFLTSLPTVWWHFKFESRLLAHLKLFQFLLDKICEAISNIKNVEYTGRPYDSDSVNFIRNMPFFDPGIELALVQMYAVCKSLNSLHIDLDKESFRRFQIIYDLLQNLIKMTEADSKQQFENIQKIFQEIEQEFKNIHLFYMRLQEKYLEVRQLIETFLRKIRKNVTPFTEIVAELQLFENFDLKSLNTLINSDRLDNVLKSIEKTKQMLRKKPAVIFKADVSKVRKMTKSLEVDMINLGLSQTKDGALLLLSCIKSLRHKMHVHQEKKMPDRHFLSLLCYENFASFFSIPYIYLVLRTCGLQLFQGISPTEQSNMDKKFDEIQEFVVTETKPTAEAILRSWCHPQNLTASRLVHNYRIKQISTIFFAISGILLFAICIKLESDNSQNLHCALPNICLKCFLLRKISTHTINHCLLLICGCIGFAMLSSCHLR